VALAFGCQLWACDCELSRAPAESASSPTGSSEGAKGGAGQGANGGDGDGDGDGEAGASGTGNDGDGTSGAGGTAGNDAAGAGDNAGGADAADPDGAGGDSWSDPRGPGLATLNRYNCVANQPFTLVLDTKGRWGRIGGWLESTAEVAFEDGLPNFEPDDVSGLRVWWSVECLDCGTAWFYGYNETKIALVKAPARLENIDVSALKFGSEPHGPASAGDVVVHKWNDQRLAVRVDTVYLGTDTLDYRCSAIDATWVFATKNAEGKLSFGEPDE